MMKLVIDLDDLNQLSEDVKSQVLQVLTTHGKSIESSGILDEYRLMIDSMKTHRYINCTPDSELPERILNAHIEHTVTVTEPDSRFGDMLNGWQSKRNTILDAAIAVLRNNKRGEQ